MIELAEKLAALKGTEIIASNVKGDSIVFVLRTGGKYTMTKAELRDAINAAQPDEPAFLNEEDGSNGGAVAPPPDNGRASPPEPTRKTKTKKGK